MSSKPTEGKTPLKERLLGFLCPLRDAVYELWVRLKERDGTLPKKWYIDGYIPDKAGRRLGNQQWMATPFRRRDELCEALPIDDIEALVGLLYSWKDDPLCKWYAITDIWGDPYIRDLSWEMVKVVEMRGTSQIQRTQQVAARTFAELLMAWPNNPARNRFGRIDR